MHLVRHANGEAPYQRFLRSYRTYGAGIKHDLVLVFKGFSQSRQVAAYCELAAGLPVLSLSIPDQGYDLATYLDVAGRLDHGALCFVNSFTELRASGWLARLVAPLGEPAVGLVGASGSWASQRSHVRYDLGLGGPYARLLGDPRRTRRLFRTLLEQNDEPLLARMGHKLRSALEIPRRLRGFEGFPAHHVRTNGFAIERLLFLELRRRRQRDKLDAYLLESGRRSLTRHVEQHGLTPLVVGRDGRRYGHREWPASNTFWQRSQQNRLIDDNQTRAYDVGAPELRLALARFAWGDCGSPEEPGEALRATPPPPKHP